MNVDKIKPTRHPAKLLDNQVTGRPVVAAVAIRDYAPSKLKSIEKSWSPMRTSVSDKMQEKGLLLENYHWDWSNKAWKENQKKYSLVALEHNNQIQGLMALSTSPIPSRFYCQTDEQQRSILYVSFLEVAPWNLSVQDIQVPQYSGVGTALMLQAIQISAERGWRGRVGLHSLPQAEAFYLNTCKMFRVGADPHCFGLIYYEYDETVVVPFASQYEIII